MELNRGPIKVRTRRHGVLRFGWVTGNSLLYIEKLDRDLAPREFTARVLCFHLESPVLGFEVVDNWSTRLLARVAKTWSLDTWTLGKELPAGVAAFEAFKAAALEQTERHTTSMRKLSSAAAAFSDLAKITARLTVPSSSISSILATSSLYRFGVPSWIGEAQKITDALSAIPLSMGVPLSLSVSTGAERSSLHASMEAVRRATESLRLSIAHSPTLAAIAGAEKPIIRLGTMGNLLPKTELLSAEVRKQIEMLRAVQDTALTGSLGRSLRTMMLAESAMLGLSPDKLGLKLALAPGQQQSLQDRLNGTVGSLAELYRSVEASAQQIRYPREVLELPALEAFTEAESIRLSSTVDADQDALADERAEATEEILTDTSEELPRLLRELGPDFVRPLIGARQVITSGYADSVRQGIVSLRELFTHVLHALAPNDRVKRWTSDPEHYHEGRPTRRCRLLYICRGMNRPPFEDFVERSVADTLLLMDLFQKGTHGLQVPYDQAQTRILLAKMEGQIRFLILTARTAEG